MEERNLWSLSRVVSRPYSAARKVRMLDDCMPYLSGRSDIARMRLVGPEEGLARSLGCEPV